MKTFWMFAFSLTLAAFPLAGKGQDSQALEAVTNAPSTEAAEQALANAPGKVVSKPHTAPAEVPVSDAVAEIVKLAHAGVEESVMLTYVSNSAALFGLDSDQIVYLNDIGVPSAVVTAMIQRDQVLKASNPALAATQAATNVPPAPHEIVPVDPAPVSVPATPTVTAPLNPPVNVSYTYFYDSLAPYGTWVDIAGYGLCWQPTVVALNPGWQPYCDRGRWVYTDCGWYWASDYTWGWAPFHYGRWFRHTRWGWCWAPDTVWGPSWVSWRYANDYCGWAPLPPTACYSPGAGFTYYGRSVGFSFSFGIAPAWFTFVHARNFCDPHPRRHRVHDRDVTRIYHNTTVINQVQVGDHNRIINRGVPVEHVSRAARTEIRPIRVRDTEDFGRVRRGERLERDRGTLTDIVRHCLSRRRIAVLWAKACSRRPAKRSGNGTSEWCLGAARPKALWKPSIATATADRVEAGVNRLLCRPAGVERIVPRLLLPELRTPGQPALNRLLQPKRRTVPGIQVADRIRTFAPASGRDRRTSR